jgi:16S rRNA (uracil1498-N3)-methyltransferase
VSESSWFIAPPEDWEPRHVVLSPEESHHALNVLRLSRSAPVSVSDGAGTVASCTLGTLQDDRVIAEISERRFYEHPHPELAVYQAAPKGSKIDALIEPLAQLGVAELRVFESSRTVVRWTDEKRRKLKTRWEAIARGAAKQSRSPFVTHTALLDSWVEVLESVERESFAVTLWEDAAASLRDCLVEAPERIAVVVGPEGGFTPEEAASLAAAGAQSVSLGPRIFRTEMAPIVACCSLLWHYGLIG